jgi:hypothetical protein
MSKQAKRKAMRSGAMSCPICIRVGRLVEHHINGREVLNWDQGWNVAWICAGCHDDLHAGDIIVEGWFRTTSGRELVWRRKGEPAKLADGASPHVYGKK